MSELDSLLRTSVIPVITLDDVRIAAPMAEALVAGGLGVIEVTLRTPTAAQVIREMAQVKGAVVGAGTVLSARDIDTSQEAGAQFLVSPGLTEALGKSALSRRVPLLPGISSASDIIRGLELGFDRFKFFPAEAAGGIRALKALAAPFRQCRFCPTGGITEQSAAAWLELDSVMCVGGSWLVPDRFDAREVRERAARAAAFRRS